MNDPLLQPDDAATPLTVEERQGLIPSYISLRCELNEADQWAFGRKRSVLDERFLTNLHQQIFGCVWRWAGYQTPAGLCGLVLRVRSNFLGC